MNSSLRCLTVTPILVLLRRISCNRVLKLSVGELPVRGLASVPHDVVGEVLFAREGLATHLAPERRVVGVTARVVGQVFLARVLLPAERAGVRRLACVPQHVVQKVLLACERFLTYITPVRRVT